MPQPPSKPLYTIGQRVQERKKAQGGITDRDLRSFTKRKLQGPLTYKNERKYIIVGEPVLKEDRLKRRSWNYPVIEEGQTQIQYKTQGIIQPVKQE